MPRNVTVIFDDGQAHVYHNVPDNVTPDQIEERAQREFPDRPVREVMGNDIVLNELRDAIASRTATMADLEEIAQRYSRRIPDDARANLQTWLDYAESHPDVDIPDNIFVAPVSPTAAIMEGAETGVRSVADTLTGAAAWVADRFGLTPADAAGWAAENLMGYSPQEAAAIRRNLSGVGGFGDIVSAGSEAVRRRPSAVRAEEQRPNYFTGGQIAGEIYGTAPFIAAGGAGLARAGGAVTRIPGAPAAVRTAGRIAQNLGRAVSSGGVGVRGVTREAVRAGAPIAATTAGRIGLRVAGGAGAGAAGAALTDQDVATSAAVGGAIPIIGTIARRGLGVTYDFLAGRVGETRAAQILRNLIAEKSTEIIAALRSAPDDARTNTAEFLAARGLLTPELAAATRVATASDVGQPLERVAQARSAGWDETRNLMRGGETGTEAVANVRDMRQAVRSETDPLRANELTRADAGRTQIIPMERAAARSEAQANRMTDTGFVPRMRGLETRSREQLDTMFQNPEFFTLDGPAARTGEIADQAGRRADDAIAAQLHLRDNAAAFRQMADNLRAQGLAPLDIAGVVGSLRQSARDAQFVNPARYRVLSSFADNLMDRARMMGGVIDAGGLYELRKGMNDQIADMLQGTDPSSLQRRTAEIVGDIKPLIDDAIEAAGGSGWRDYLNRFSEGMTRVERQEFGRRLADLPENRLERVLTGNDPDFVSDFFGPGRYDINAELLPEVLPHAQRMAGEIAASRDVAAAGLRDLPTSLRLSLPTGARNRVMAAFEPGLRNTFARGLSRIAAGAPGIYGGGVAADQLARQYSAMVAENAMRRLAPALANPAEALRLLPMQSANAMLERGFDRLAPTARTYASQTLQQMMTPPPAENVMPAEDLMPEDQVFIGFQIGPDGREYPLYGPAGGR